MKTLIIAEKPSVAKNIADALNVKGRQDGYFEGNNDVIISWAYGHLLRLLQVKEYEGQDVKWNNENFPYFPKTFKYATKKDTVKQVKVIRDLISRKDVEGIILATDNDREGQLIGDSLFKYIGVRKPIRRILLDSWTKEEVDKGMKNLVSNNSMSNLSAAAFARQWTDWLIGINLTVLVTIKFGGGQRLLNVGRVIIPTLKIVYDRDKAISDFKPEDFYRLIAEFDKDGSSYEGVFKATDKSGKLVEKFRTSDRLQEILAQIRGKNGKVIEKTTTLEKKGPGLLFNQTKLQEFVTKNFDGWTSDKVLATCQSLYEKKHITYPRTESQALMESSKQQTMRLLDKVRSDADVDMKRGAKLFNDKKVDSHEAIIPTMNVPNLDSLSEDERTVYNVIRARFVAQFMPPAIFEVTKIITAVGPYKFYTSGKCLKQKGFLIVEPLNTKDKLLPDVSEGDAVKTKKMDVNKGQTTPPKPMTEGELLLAMMNCGKQYKDEDAEAASVLSGFSIGTGATRHEAIKKDVAVGYLVRKGKTIRTTPFGRQLVEKFPVPSLLDLEFTGRMEQRLKNIQDGKESMKSFMAYVNDFVKESSDIIKNSTTVIDAGSSLGKCPICESPVIETKMAFSCSNRLCKFALWKNDRYLECFGKKMTKTIAKDFLIKGKAKVKKLKSKKTGKEFDATIVPTYYVDEDKFRIGYKMEFENALKKK